MPEVDQVGKVAVNDISPRRLRGQTLFYTDAVNLLRTIYPVTDYEYRDGGGFRGELLIYRENQIVISVEIKSETETKAVSSQRSGKAFKVLRDKIHSIQCLKNNGKAQGWIAFLAQCWHYMASNLPRDIQSGHFPAREDILVIPSDRETDLVEALACISSHHSDCPSPTPTALRYPSVNVSVLIYCHQTLTDFFEKIQRMEQ